MTPIVFIHRGNQEYLFHSLKQCRFFNPNLDIYLIGDQKEFNDNKFSFEPLSHYDSIVSDFEGIYKHLSTNPYDFELFCIVRWFVLSAFMREKKIKKVFYLDSDVLIFSDISILEKSYYENEDCTLMRDSLAASSFISYDLLEEFRSLVMNSYCRNESWGATKINGLFNSMTKRGAKGGVSDMTFFSLLKRSSSLKFKELDEIVDQETFDINFNIGEHSERGKGFFEMENGHKKIFWRNELPHGKTNNSGELIRFHSLHFQGSAKSYLADYITYSNYLKNEN